MDTILTDEMDGTNLYGLELGLRFFFFLREPCILVVWAASFVRI